MTVNFYEGKDNKPHRLFVVSDRVTMHDRIVFTEACFAVDDKCVSFYGVLSFQCVGVESSKDKAWKVDGQKVLLSFYKDKKPTWNNETKKFEDKEVDASESYLYGFAKDVLKNVDGNCASVVIAPYVAPQFLEDMKVPQEEAVIAYWEGKVKNTIVAVKTDFKLLTDSDKELLKTTSLSSTGGKTYQKPESESEKLEARWEFLKHHLGKNYPISSLYELGALLAHSHTDDEGANEQQALAKTLELIARMWK
ncbi:hypothetical protein [Microcoleus asticus]|uniref:Uncharacterized protein n=1 Tax=Microcoleus asticus IPMA8 TaxID=2563858 RepID=A0ABX2CYE2_9CYAN|nr:hypothetical protein [Microcoleus asticus]NQE35213.1 hypothetical protein [Microcoleus asticus IPMA8]